jgi:hypothetical protein
MYLADLDEWFVIGKPSVAHQHIKPARFFQRKGYGTLDISRDRNIPVTSDNIQPFSLEGDSDSAEFISPVGEEDDMPTLTGETLGSGFADAG